MALLLSRRLYRLERAYPSVIVPMLSIARRPEVPDLVTEALDLTGERFDRVPRNEDIGALPCLLGLDPSDGLAVGG